MKRIGNQASTQLKPVLLLLAVAVILPTICLLWFMTQAVENIQVVTKQKLVGIYQEKLGEAVVETGNLWKQELSCLDTEAAGKTAFALFDSLQSRLDYAGAVIYDETGTRIYPLFSTDVNAPVELADTFAQAWQAEFAEQDYNKAATLYEKIAESKNLYTRFTAVLGQARSHAKLARSGQFVGFDEKKHHLEAAVGTCETVAFNNADQDCDIATLMLLANARLLMIELAQQRLDLSAETRENIESLIWDAYHQLYKLIFKENEVGSFLPCDQQIFIVRRVLDIYEKYPFLQKHPDDGTSAQMAESAIRSHLAAEELSVCMVEHFPDAAALANWPNDQFRLVSHSREPVYAVRHVAQEETVMLFCREKIIRRFGPFEETFKNSDVAYRIVDDTGRFVAGAEKSKTESSMTITAAVGKHFTGWKAQLFFKEGDVFEKAASRQVTIYIWAGVLVIVLILAAGGFAGQVVGRQIKLNKLKNDFIATVSHELKTPLSSMRVLVDTLLQGNYNDQKQATEYLHLISKENLRLSRLIDNFLTFSRMERNKRAFDMAQASPAEIASDASEVVQTKFTDEKCKFEIQIDENIPDILADHDAMVTVLVNLLDNAYKYSYDDKDIELKVFAEAGSVSFSVRDNGAGMSRRAVKRIFNRFYQADSSLSRTSEGCGLGLSIVKFIVDAHKGRVSVDSKPGKGSTFTVKLPRHN